LNTEINRINYQELWNNSQTEAHCIRIYIDIRIFEFCFTTLKSWTFLSRHWHHFSLDAISCERHVLSINLLMVRYFPWGHFWLILLHTACFVFFIIGLSAFFPGFIYVLSRPIHSQTNKSPKDFYVSLWVTWSRLYINKLRKKCV
jgi:hypothetical protein